MVWQGLSAQVYDLNAYVTYSQSLFPGSATYAWFYPPTTLLATAPLALIPPLACYLIVVFGQMVLFGLLIFRYFRKQHIMLFTLAGSALLLNAIYSQFGILWASFLLLALQALKQGEQTRAGIWLALLSLKPHYGIIIPFALIAAKQWRCIVVTSVAILIMGLISVSVFGMDTWLAYIDSLSLTSTTLQDPQAFFGSNPNGMTNIFSFGQSIGMPVWLCWSLQAIVIALSALAVFHVWKQQHYSFEWKAAVLILSTIISMPWSFTYDMVLLNVWVAYVLILYPRHHENNQAQLIALWILPLLILSLTLQQWIPDGMSNILLLWPAWIMWNFYRSGIPKPV
jgi:hypothetical protein